MNNQSNRSWVKPNPTLKNLEVLVGEWDLVGSHPLIPSQVRGRAIFAWLEEGAFLTWHTDMEQSGPPNGSTVIGRDDSIGDCIVLYYDERGVSRIYAMSLENNVWKMWRNAPGFFQRMTGVLSDDQNIITVHGELSKDGSHWDQDLDLIYTRILTK